MTDLTALAAEIERRVRDMGRSPRPENDAISLGFYIAGQVQALLSALRASRPEPAADAVEADLPAQLDRMADWLAPLHGAWVAREAARQLRDRAIALTAVEKELGGAQSEYSAAIDALDEALRALAACMDSIIFIAQERGADWAAWSHPANSLRWGEKVLATSGRPMPLRGAVLAALPRPAVNEGAVERAAKALCRRRWPDRHSERPCRGYPCMWKHFEDDARAALAAAQSPTNTAGD